MQWVTDIFFSFADSGMEGSFSCRQLSAGLCPIFQQGSTRSVDQRAASNSRGCIADLINFAPEHISRTLTA